MARVQRALLAPWLAVITSFVLAGCAQESLAEQESGRFGSGEVAPLEGDGTQSGVAGGAGFGLLPDEPEPGTSPDLPFSCTAFNTCDTAEDLGTVRGDEGSDQVIGGNARGAWYKVRVREAVGGLEPVDLHFSASLRSPKGSNYDLTLYTACGGAPVADSVLPAGQSDRVSYEKKEKPPRSSFSDGTDNSFDVFLFVQFADGRCEAERRFELVARR